MGYVDTDAGRLDDGKACGISLQIASPLSQQNKKRFHLLGAGIRRRSWRFEERGKEWKSGK